MPSKKSASEIKTMVEAQAKGKKVRAARSDRKGSEASGLDERRTKAKGMYEWIKA
jgi:hypothetical protein